MSDQKNDADERQKTPHRNPPDIFLNPSNLIAIYTGLSILLKMKKHLGLEAMLEYVEKYLRRIETSNPQIRPAVKKAITFINVEKLYREVQCYEED